MEGVLRYIPKEALPNLKKYKYSCYDASPVSKYVMQPYWTFCVQFLPMWLAPNLVTLIGFLVLLANYLIVAYYTPTFSVNPPGWVYLSCAFSLQFYSLLDNLDGKQARRTQSSSPLGELFDHGCDSVACVVITLVSCSVFHIQGDFAIWLLAVGTLAFWLATWEEYHTGSLFLGYINGPTEGIQILSFMYFITYFIGGDFWKQNMGDVVSFSSFLSEIKVSVIVATVLMLPTVLTFFFNVKSVVEFCKKEKRSQIFALKEIFFFFFVIALLMVYYYLSPDLWFQYPHLFFLSFGICVSELTHRLILAHVTHQTYSLLQRPIFLLLLSVCNTSLKYFGREPYIDEVYCAIGILVLQIMLFGHYVVGVVHEITSYLEIMCFRIKPKVN